MSDERIFLAPGVYVEVLEECRTALLALSTDMAQDMLEDPCGNADRRAAGWVRVSASLVPDIQAAIKAVEEVLK